MIYSKTPLDYNSIIEMMKSRGLIIADEQKAINYLKVISYFRLANYIRPMEKDKETHLYKSNSHFDNAIDLYYFDKELRSIIFAVVQSIDLEYMHNQIHFNNNFKKRLDALLKEHPNVDIAAMGFPKDWKKEPLWK